MSRFSWTVSETKMRRPCGTRLIPASLIRWGGETCDVDAVEHHATAARRRQPGKRSAQRRLADTVPPENGRNLAALGAEGDTLQHMAVAVVRVEVEDFEHRLG